MTLAALYEEHLEILARRHSEAMEAAGYSRLVVHSGVQRLPTFDDNHYPFKVNPHFKYWLPLLEHPHCFMDFRIGQMPRLIYFQPEDYWHKTPADPEGYWAAHFDIELVTQVEDGIRALGRELGHCAFIGEEACLIPGLAEENINPAKLLGELHYYRAYKTRYEAECLRRANRIAAAGHLSARDAFSSGGSELDIHHAYLQGAGVLEVELPYANIVAMNSHGAVLHYHGADRHGLAAKDIHSLVIDAGASFAGYASDITRSYAYRDGVYAELLHDLDHAQRSLVNMLEIGEGFAGLHWQSHLMIAEILQCHGFVDMAPQRMVAEGVTNVFFPCGLGHFIGLQVHDVGGYQMDPRSQPEKRDPRAPFLRLARKLEAGQALTIEPGIYFMDMLLGELSRSKHSSRVNWDKVDAFRRYGGVRVEDCVLMHEDRVENQSRDAFEVLLARKGDGNPSLEFPAVSV